MKRYRTSVVCAFLILPGAGMMFAQAKPAAQEAAKEKKPPAASAAPAAVTIPAEAKQTAPGTYTYTDAQGKKWIYRKTPFGVAKFEDKDGTAAAERSAQKAAENVTAVEDGEYIKFERSSPFGTYRWRQKKTALGPLEQAAWERAREKQVAAREKE